jgi:hypothetical protein
MSNISSHVSEAWKKVLEKGPRNSGQGQTFKIQLKDEWLYCSHGLGGMLLKINR